MAFFRSFIQGELDTSLLYEMVFFGGVTVLVVENTTTTTTTTYNLLRVPSLRFDTEHRVLNTTGRPLYHGHSHPQNVHATSTPDRKTHTPKVATQAGRARRPKRGKPHDWTAAFHERKKGYKPGTALLRSCMIGHTIELKMLNRSRKSSTTKTPTQGGAERVNIVYF